VDPEKDVLKQIIRFGDVPQNAVSDRTHDAGIPTKEARQSIWIAVANASDQGFVGCLGRRGTLVRDNSCLTIFFGEANSRQPDCS
jgi:hypothetical protein